jgi:hypothetical protein
MILNLEKISQLEKQFKLHGDNISINALNIMVNDVLAFDDKTSMSYKTLLNLNVITEKDNNKQQLNS